MIKSFAIDNRAFTLVPKKVLEEPDLNIFAANSMTLFVGPNGSGKTQTLASLAGAISQPSTSNVEIDWAKAEDRDSTYVMYFTPVPYSKKMPRESTRFSILQSRTRSENLIPEVKIAMELASEFDLDAGPTLLMPSYSTALDNLQSMLLHSATDQRYRYVTDDWLVPLAERQRQVESRRSAYRREQQEKQVSLDVTLESRVWKDLWEEQHAIERDFSLNFESHLGPHAALRLRAYKFVAGKQRFTADVRSELLSLLGFTPAKPPKRKQPKARRLFEDALLTLGRMAAIVGDPSLKNSRYKLNLKHWSQLSKISTTGLAELSIVGVSSGSAALLDQFARIRREVKKISTVDAIRNLLILIDEGDAFLHLEWQQKYVNYLDKTVQESWRDRFDCIQIVLTTHSPVLMSDFPKDCIHKLEMSGDESSPSIRNETKASFGAPLDAIVRSTGGAGTLGMFATRIMRELLDDINAGRPVDSYRVDMIDDPIIWRHIKMIQETMQRTSEKYAD
jgi:predicted ATPase